MTHDARRELLGELIDHAALFPPASMDMPEAMEADRVARGGDHAWMLGRFICPASRLGELPVEAPRLSVVLDGGEGDLEAVHDARLAGREVELVEARIDPAWIPDTQELVHAKLGEGVEAFWELAPGRGLRGAVAAVREARAGAKIRCGGATPAPPVEALAEFVAACRDAGVRFKATAGLHHAIRAGDAHGFLNVLAAAVFAYTDGLTAEELMPLLAEEDPAAFAVDAAGLVVNDRSANAEQIAETRRDLFVAYGSCSFDEPVEDLTALGMLPG
ncbi:MAG TPA: hypothetical protein VFX51_27470 [Solirubrobacteraceae bacterium]|nr:hypothetical protein [Solirubrobacteraceae bacterium]